MLARVIKKVNIFGGDSIGNFDKKNRMVGLGSNSELLPRQSCWNPARTDRPSLLSYALHSCLWSWTKSEVYKRKVDTRDELPARILHAPARIKESEYQLRRATRDLRTRDAKCTELCGCDFRIFIVNS